MCLEKVDWAGFDEVAEASENGVPNAAHLVVDVKKSSLLRVVRDAVLKRVKGEEDSVTKPASPTL